METIPPVSNPQPIPTHGLTTFGYLSTWEFILSCEVLLFGVIVLVFLYISLRNRRVSPDDILRTVAVTLVIIGSLFSMTAGFSSAQIAPVIGLFGTIIGYIIGKRTDSGEKGSDKLKIDDVDEGDHQ